MNKWMKRTIALVLMALILVAALPVTAVMESANRDADKVMEAIEKKSPAKKATKYYALLVGNTKYKYINSLRGPKYDLAAMKALLKGTKQKWKITVAKNATAEKMRSSIYKAFKGSTKKDVCLFYYSGHGVNSGPDSDQGALCGAGCYSGSSGIEDVLRGGSLAYALNEATPGKVIVLLDSCGSGGMIKNGSGKEMTEKEAAAEANLFVDNMISSFAYFDNQAQKEMEKIGELKQSKFHVIAACEYGKTSTELGSYGSSYAFGVFTEALCTSMGFDHKSKKYTSAKMTADKNSDGKMTMKELTAGIKSRVKYWNSYMGQKLQVTKTYGKNSLVFFIK